MSATQASRETLVISVFERREQAERLVEALIEDDFPMDRLSLLHRAGGSGDDPLGVVYRSEGERIRVWGQQGALWGALGGLLAGLTGVFVLPGLGPLLAAGPIVDALAGALAGATLGGGGMAGAAALTGLTTALRGLRIPEHELEALEQAVQQGGYLVVLHAQASDAERWARRLRWAGATRVIEV